MRATITVTGPTLDALSAALDIASGSIVTDVREGEGWEDDGAVTYAIVVEGEDDPVVEGDEVWTTRTEPSWAVRKYGDRDTLPSGAQVVVSRGGMWTLVQAPAGWVATDADPVYQLDEADAAALRDLF